LGGNNGKIDVLTTGGSPAYSYLWANGQTTPTVSNLAVGDYTVTVTDKNACKSSTVLHVDSIAPMIATAITKNVLCLPLTNGVIDLTVAQGSAPYQYFWSNGKTTEDLSNLSAGSYRVTVKDANGCVLTQFYSLKNDSAFHIQASPTVTITLGESTELNVTHDAPGSVSFNWNTTSESSMSCTTCQSTTVTPPYYSHFTVNATDDRGCVAKDTVSVFVIADHKLWVPNAFTPNSDGNNDLFQVFGNYKAMKNFGIKIFDRWGEMVFESESPEFTWDGTFKGTLMPPGVYVYVLETGFIDGSDPVHMKGSLTSIR
jgi:gliding motility-associated-like protein